MAGDARPDRNCNTGRWPLRGVVIMMYPEFIDRFTFCVFTGNF